MLGNIAGDFAGAEGLQTQAPKRTRGDVEQTKSWLLLCQLENLAVLESGWVEVLEIPICLLSVAVLTPHEHRSTQRQVPTSFVGIQEMERGL